MAVWTKSWNRCRKRTNIVYKFRADIIVITLVTFGIMCSGCSSGARELELKQELDLIRSENIKLRKQVESLTVKVDSFDKRIKTLSQLGDKRLDLLYTVKKITLGRHTGGVDTDKKPGHDAIVVYLSLTDQYGSKLKAAGSVQIKLYDLATEEGKNNLIGNFSYTPEEAAKEWISGLLSYNYKFRCPWPPARTPVNNQITVRVSFTDYLTGKTHTAQKVCDIVLSPQNGS